MKTLALLLIFVPQAVFAQQVGDKVMPKMNANVMMGATELPWGDFGLPLTVKKVQDDWIWVGGGEIRKGKIRKDDVVALAVAPAYYTEFLRNNPNSSRAYIGRGIAWSQKGEFDKAIRDATDAIRIDPEHAPAYLNRGVARGENGEFTKSINDFTESIRLDPRFAPAYTYRGRAWSEKGEFDKAIRDTTEAIRIDPDFAPAFISRGIVWRKKGKLHKAIRDFTEAIQLDPAYASAYHNRGFAWRKMDLFDKAIRDYSESIRLDPKHASSYCHRGNAREKKGEFDNALKDYNDSIRLDPANAPAFSSLAWLYATCRDSKYRDGEKAVINGLTACELTEWKTDSHITTLAAAYAEAGDFDEAMKWLGKAMEMNPGNSLRGPALDTAFTSLTWTEQIRNETRQEMLLLFKQGKPYRAN